MTMDRVIYFLGTFFLSLLIISSFAEFALGLHPVAQAPFMAIGILSGLVIPAITYVTIDELTKKYEEWKNGKK